MLRGLVSLVDLWSQMVGQQTSKIPQPLWACDTPLPVIGRGSEGEGAV